MKKLNNLKMYEDFIGFGKPTPDEILCQKICDEIVRTNGNCLRLTMTHQEDYDNQVKMGSKGDPIPEDWGYNRYEGIIDGKNVIIDISPNAKPWFLSVDGEVADTDSKKCYKISHEILKYLNK